MTSHRLVIVHNYVKNVHKLIEIRTEKLFYFLILKIRVKHLNFT